MRILSFPSLLFLPSRQPAMSGANSISIPSSMPIDGSVRVPGSKSITNRAILIASLAEGTSLLKNALHSDDTHYMKEAWRNLGAEFRERGDSWEITGCGGRLKPLSREIYVGNAGTAARFLTASLTLGSGEYILTGNERMRKRPIKDLIEALNRLGGRVKDMRRTGCPPVLISANALTGGTVAISGRNSSQYVSAVMMAAPFAKNRTTIEIEGDLVSRTYVEMTQKIMVDFGIDCSWHDPNSIVVEANQIYRAREYAIEADASSASYFFGMAAVTGGVITVRGIKRDSTQGDMGLVGILEKMGCVATREKESVTLAGGRLKGVEVDMNTMSDVAPTLAVVSLFAEGRTTIRNVENMRIKECDRISALAKELKKLGAKVEELRDGLKIWGGAKYRGAAVDPHDDHRLAMSMALAGLRIPGVKIQNPGCVAKTYPNFFRDFAALTRR